MDIFSLLFAAFVILLVCDFSVRRRPKNYPPGPFPLPVIGNVLNLLPNPQTAVKRLVAKYGPVLSMQFGYYKAIIVSDPKLIREVTSIGRATPDVLYMQHGHVYKDKFVGIMAVEGEDHAETVKFMRKTVRSICSSPSKVEFMIMEEVEEEIRDFKQHALTGSPIESSDLFAVATMAVIWRIMVGKRPSRDDKGFKTMVDLTIRSLKILTPASPVFFFPWICKLAPSFSGSNTIADCAAQIIFFLDQLVKNRREGLEDKAEKDENIMDAFLTKIGETKDANSVFHQTYGYAHLKSTFMILFNAGSDTVATTLKWALLFLVTEKGLQETLHRELDQVVGLDRKPSLTDRENLPRLMSFINELLRYTSILPLGVPHAVPEDLHLHGYFIPKGTLIMTDLYGINHHESTWGPDASQFKPERFLAPKSSKIQASLPFSTGKNLCPGESIARDQLFLYLASFLHTFNFKLSGNEKPSMNPDPTKMVLAPESFNFNVEIRNKDTL